MPGRAGQRLVFLLPQCYTEGRGERQRIFPDKTTEKLFGGIRTMEKQELLKIMDGELLEKLFSFCYARTSDSREARELCSDIVFELIKAANTEGDIGNLYGFLWKVARNTYADFSDKRSRNSDRTYHGDPEDLFSVLASPDCGEDDRELLDAVYRQIAFLTKAYREVMILFYLDGLPVAEIARQQNTSEGAIRERLSSARKRIRSEVEKMAESSERPVVLDQIEYWIMGEGNPLWGDPRKLCTRQLPRHLIWLCRKKSVSAAEAAEQLHVPTVYVEEEMELLRKGENGQYGLLRWLNSGSKAATGKGTGGSRAAGRYAINFLLFDTEEMEQLRAAYREQIPDFCRVVLDYVGAHREEYMAFPYLNRRKDWNLILWQQVHAIAHIFEDCVEGILDGKYFAGVDTGEGDRRPFGVFGYVREGVTYGGGLDGMSGENICGYAKISVYNITNKWVEPHLMAGHDMANDTALQLAIRAVDGLAVEELSEAGREHAARAIECGYLYREGDRLHTKILVYGTGDEDRLFRITNGLVHGYLEEAAQSVAEKVAGCVRRFVPEHLLGEWKYANRLAAQPVLDALLDALVAAKALTPPENGVGAEGCWMCVEK